MYIIFPTVQFDRSLGKQKHEVGILKISMTDIYICIYIYIYIYIYILFMCVWVCVWVCQQLKYRKCLMICLPITPLCISWFAREPFTFLIFLYFSLFLRNANPISLFCVCVCVSLSLVSLSLFLSLYVSMCVFFSLSLVSFSMKVFGRWNRFRL